MANKKRAPIIEGNKTLDKIAQRFASKCRKIEREIKALDEVRAEKVTKLTETRAALNALKAGA